MAGHWTDMFSFATGVLRNRSTGYVVLSDDNLNSQKVPHSGFVVWHNNQWMDGGRTNWPTAGVAVIRSPAEQLCAVGLYGDVLLLGSGDRHEEQIGAGGELPKMRGPLRGVRTIGGKVYVVGMNCQAYRRDNVNVWVNIDRGARPDLENRQIVGFEAVDGFSDKEIYAAGWDGEIWVYDGSMWRQADSPTNLVLTGLCCAQNGVAYATGRRGLLLRGRDNQWEIIEHSNIIDDIWGVAWFNNKLYLATANALYTLEGDNLHLVDMGKDPPKTCYCLSAADGVLWSIGAKDIVAFDGNEWTRID